MLNMLPFRMTPVNLCYTLYQRLKSSFHFIHLFLNISILFFVSFSACTKLIVSGKRKKKKKGKKKNIHIQIQKRQNHESYAFIQGESFSARFSY